MALTLYNTLERAKQEFVPIDPTNVRMYVCGPTVYDYAHIGNARPVVVFDVLYRLLRNQYGADCVKYVRNITDVDDKIIAAAGETGGEIDSITQHFAKIFQDDMAVLGALPPDLEPRATDHIPEMIVLMKKLEDDGFAYAAEGHVLFSVASMADYGRLSRHSRDELIAGARVEVAPYKKDAADFVLWKPSTDDQPGWDSPWGRGRPGWHLECSAMSEKHLGPHFDIHGGGLDLIFPHHENEIAQSACAHEDHQFVNYWIHNGYVTVGGEKMSKSEGNFITVHDLLDEGFRGEAIRLALLMGHYRQPLDITREKIVEARKQLDRLYGALRTVADVRVADIDQSISPVRDSLEDDLNTPNAISHLHELASTINRANGGTDKSMAKAQLVVGGALLGILGKNPEDWFKGGVTIGVPQGNFTLKGFPPTVEAGKPGGINEARRSGVDIEIPPGLFSNLDDLSIVGAVLTENEIDELVEARTQARKDKNFGESDRIRDELAEQGIILEDGPNGTIWRRE